MFEWIEVLYNQQRRHSTLGMLAPLTYANATPWNPLLHDDRQTQLSGKVGQLWRRPAMKR